VFIISKNYYRPSDCGLPKAFYSFISIADDFIFFNCGPKSRKEIKYFRVKSYYYHASKVIVNGNEFGKYSFNDGFITLDIPVNKWQPVDIQIIL